MGTKITGIHAIEEALKNAAGGSTLYLLRGDKRNIDLELKAKANGKTAIKKVSIQELDRLAGSVGGEASHRGAVLDIGVKNNIQNQSSIPAIRGGRIRETTVQDFCNSLKEGDSALVLALDEITDPHNLGAILRSADQFSASLIIVPERRSASANETVIRISSGAAQYVTMATVTNLGRELDILKDYGFWVYGADMNGESSYKMEFSKRSVIVMGSEGKGMRSLVRQKCDHMLSIPMYGHIDSLNVSVAAGILMYEYRRSQKVEK
ncbi:MAG: 23S rRNA (guanosine(2251)-2'-O)-methyltransferase RlmB [Sphaerochaetaceae bacterium]|nr:23S rRNA (guanosine(2251)-2'-O)-methyltransferase RlmB [Sphaerochaetaceae bacterium]